MSRCRQSHDDSATTDGMHAPSFSIPTATRPERCYSAAQLIPPRSRRRLDVCLLHASIVLDVQRTGTVCLSVCLSVAAAARDAFNNE